jgi:hypothetical protein
VALSDWLKAVFGIVGAGRLLTNADKRVWEKHAYMDAKGLGTEMSATTMGLLLGMGSETVEESRRRLLRVGLLQRSEGRGCRTRWFARFPESWMPRLPAKPRAEEYAAAADELDRLMAAALAGEREEIPRESRPRPRDSHQQYQQRSQTRKPGRDPGFLPPSRPASVRGEGERGGEAPPLSPCSETASPSSPSSPNSGGDVDAQQEDGGELPARMDFKAEWNAQKDAVAVFHHQPKDVVP